VLTVDDLENLETSVEHFGFRDLLSDYVRSCSDGLEPLHNFIASSEYKQHIYHNRNIATSGLDILDKVKEAIFPEY